MNNQNYRQNLKNPAGKQGTDEPQQAGSHPGSLNKTNFRQNGPGYPHGNQQPYHAGPQPGPETETTAYQNNSPSGTRPNWQSNTSHSNGMQRESASYSNEPQQRTPSHQNAPSQGIPPYQKDPQQGVPPYQNSPQQGIPPYQNGAQQGNAQAYQSGPQQAYGQQQGNTQQQSNTQDNWMNNPNLKGMDPEKLKMLNNIANQGSQKGMSELMPFLMSAVSQNKNKPGGLDFSHQEMDTIIEVLKMGKPPEEVARINRMMQIMKMMH